MQVCSGQSGVADTAARVRGGAGRESRRRFGRHAWDLERDSLGHGYLARKHHPARVGEKPRRWQNVGRSRSCGLQTWGLGRPELQAPQGQGGGPAEDGSDRAGRGRAREEGRMAWGQSATGKRRREGEGQAPAGEAERAAPATVWPRGDLGREGRNTRPRAVDAKGCLCPHGRALWSGQQLNRAGTKPWRLSALLPGRGHWRRREHSSPFILGEICRSCPANFPSGGRTGCVPGHTHPHL